jgi:AraC family transcriptional regulator
MADTSECSPAASGSATRSAIREVYAGRDFSVRYFFCGCGPDDPPYEEVHQDTCLGAVLSGFFSYQTAHSTNAMSAGAILLGNKGHPYQCGHEHSRGDVSLVFAVDHSLLEAALDFADSRSSTAEFALAYLPATPNLSVTIGRAQAAAAARNGFWLEEIVHTLVASAMCPDFNPFFEKFSPSSKDMGRASDVIQFIEKNYSSHLTLAELADIAGVSSFHFVRIFRAVTGITPYQFVMRLRLREAATQLLRTKNPITDIAFQVGYGDLSRFIRTFKAASGLSPSGFRFAYS